MNAAVAQGYLGELGCTCVWVDNGSEAVARSATERFDMIMMDLNMPDMDGLATARLMREREGTGPHIPIVALTAHEPMSYRDVVPRGRHERRDGQALYARRNAHGYCAAGSSSSPNQAGEPENAAPSPARRDVVAPHGRSQVDTATVTALQEPARGRSAGSVFATRRLVRDRIHPGDDRGRLGARGRRSRRGERGLPQIGRKRRQCRGTAPLRIRRRTLEELCRQRDATRAAANIRGDARRPSRAHGRAVATLSFGERVSELPAPADRHHRRR